MPDLTPATLRELRELLAGSTRLPWRWARELDGIEARAILDDSGYFFASSDDEQNAKLAIAAVNAIPALLDAAEGRERLARQLAVLSEDAFAMNGDYFEVLGEAEPHLSCHRLTGSAGEAQVLLEELGYDVGALLGSEADEEPSP